MNAFQTCKDVSDIAPLYIPQQLFLKPIAKINISLQLPNVVKNGKSISHLEIMEKLRELLKPQEFSILKVSKSTLEFVRFEAEVDNRKKLEPAVLKLNNKTIKLKNFSELMRVKAAVSKSDFPNRHIWDGFFNEAKDMNETKPGERPDTIHLSNLPTKWFVPYHLLDEEDILPSEKLFFKIFEKFGPIRHVDIPICDPYRNKMKDHISGIKNCTWENKTIFEGYVQFKDYMGFSKCMDYLRDMKLLHKEEEETYAADMRVDFDRSKHLSEASIRRREIVRDRLVKKQKEKEERERDEVEEKRRKEKEEKEKELTVRQQKEQRRRLREEKRKAAILEKLKIKSADEINAKIAKEEKKLMKAQRKLESIRLIEELFKRIKEKRVCEEVNSYNTERSRHADSELKKFKYSSEKELLEQKQKLHSVLQGRVMLKSVLKDGTRNFSSSSSDEETAPSQSAKEDVIHPMRRLAPADIYQDNLMYGFPHHFQELYPPSVRGHPAFNLIQPRGRGGYFRGSNYPSGSRGGYFNNRRGRGYKSQYRGGYQGGRNQYPPELEEEYIKYFSKFLHNEHDQRRGRSRSQSRRRSHSRRRSYSRSRSRSRRRSRSRSYSRQRSKSRSRSNSRRMRSRRSRSRNKSSPRRTRRSESKQRSRSRSRSSPRRSKRSESKQRSRSRNKSNSRRSRSESKQRSRSRNKSNSRRSKRSESKEKTRSRKTSSSKKGEKERTSKSPSADSVDSSKFISPNRMRKQRSKSWSLPKDEDKRKERDSWSKSPEKKN